MSSCGTCEEDYISRIESLRREVENLTSQLAVAKSNEQATHEANKRMAQQLAECERERDEHKLKHEQTVTINERLMSDARCLKEQLTTVTAEREIDEQRVADLMAQVGDIAKERDELVNALAYYATDESADGWVAIAAISKIKHRGSNQVTASDAQKELKFALHNLVSSLCGEACSKDTSYWYDYAIKTLAKVGAGETGEVG